MTSRRLRVLLQHLPPESATMTALRNDLTDEELAEHADKGEPEKGYWSQTEQLLAAIVDGIRRLEFITICANTEAKDQPEPPTPIRRPGAKLAPPRPALSASDRDFLFQLINGGAA
ncbi:hypothetical protein ACFC0S_16735 [Streptomyces sp. NPDC056084]|uniref:hypothetical protein n=1 Tax=unclassified Streptomyces TaxID=2593676 RepID=UPI0035E139F1